LNATTLSALDCLILNHHFTAPPPGSVVLQTARFEVRRVDQVLGTVTADTRDDARSAAAERWGGEPDDYSVRYVGSVVEHFTIENEEEAADAA
jgi:hypothetical protein